MSKWDEVSKRDQNKILWMQQMRTKPESEFTQLEFEMFLDTLRLMDELNVEICDIPAEMRQNTLHKNSEI